VLVNLLETDRLVDFNGVILLSQLLNVDNSPDAPQFNIGMDLPYELVLPSFAASAWYHHKLPGAPAELAPWLTEAEHFAMSDYAMALEAGSTLPDEQRQAIAAKLHQYTGLPIDYILKADLRISGGEFAKNLQGDTDTTTGRLDARFSGPTLDPLSKQADYDPQSAAMKYNPDLHVLLNAGYFDLATPFYEGVYEMQHLGLQSPLRKNIEFAFYQSGHMVYAHQDALKLLHDNGADFIRRTAAPPH